MTEKEILEMVKNPKVSADSDDEFDNGFNDAVPVPSTSEVRKMINSVRCYLDAHSNGEMSKTIDDLEQFVDNIALKNTFQKKITAFFSPK